MRHLYSILFSVFILVLGASALKAQELKLSKDSSHISIGQQLAIDVEFKFKQGSQVYWPEWSTFPKYEYLNAQERVEKEKDGSVIQSQRVYLTSFDSGFHAIEPLPFLIRAKGEKQFDTLWTEAFTLQVKMPEIDTSLGLYDIKAQIEAERTLVEILFWVLTPIILALLIYLIYYLRKTRQAEVAEVKAAVIPKIIPIEVALKALGKMESEKAWTQENHKKYHTELTDVFRRFVEDEYHIPALESTTDELMQRLRPIAISPERLSQIQEVLSRADLVKFAKWIPKEDENLRSFEMIKNFFEQLRSELGKNPIEAK